MNITKYYSTNDLWWGMDTIRLNLRSPNISLKRKQNWFEIIKKLTKPDRKNDWDKNQRFATSSGDIEKAI